MDWHPNHSNGSGGKDCSYPRKHSDTMKVATHRVATANWATTLDALLSIGNTLLCNGLPIHAVPGTGHALWCKAKFAQIEPGCWVPDWLAFFSLSLRACREHWAAQLDCFVLKRYKLKELYVQNTQKINF